MSETLEKLYETDFHAWSRHQADALRALARARWNGPLDLEHLAEEVEDLGDERRNAVRSQLRRIIEHCLKLRYSPAAVPRPGWMHTVADARDRIEDRITPAIRRDIEAQLPRLYRQAARKARFALEERGEQQAASDIPDDCPFGMDALLDDDWFPSPERASGE